MKLFLELKKMFGNIVNDFIIAKDPSAAKLLAIAIFQLKMLLQIYQLAKLIFLFWNCKRNSFADL